MYSAGAILSATVETWRQRTLNNEAALRVVAYAIRRSFAPTSRNVFNGADGNLLPAGPATRFAEANSGRLGQSFAGNSVWYCVAVPYGS